MIFTEDDIKTAMNIMYYCVIPLHHLLGKKPRPNQALIQVANSNECGHAFLRTHHGFLKMLAHRKVTAKEIEKNIEKQIQHNIILNTKSSILTILSNADDATSPSCKAGLPIDEQFFTNVKIVQEKAREILAYIDETAKSSIHDTVSEQTTRSFTQKIKSFNLEMAEILKQLQYIPLWHDSTPARALTAINKAHETLTHTIRSPDHNVREAIYLMERHVTRKKISANIEYNRSRVGTTSEKVVLNFIVSKVISMGLEHAEEVLLEYLHTHPDVIDFILFHPSFAHNAHLLMQEYAIKEEVRLHDVFKTLCPKSRYVTDLKAHYHLSTLLTPPDSPESRPPKISNTPGARGTLLKPRAQKQAEKGKLTSDTLGPSVSRNK